VEKKIIRLLIVDDSPDDCEIAAGALRKAGHMLKSQSVQDLVGFQTAIEKGNWDLIISEYALPHFGAGLALEVLKRARLEIPLLVLTRAIRDADLTKIMQAGARDVIVKGRVTRLVPAIERELAVAAERAQYRKASKDLKEMEDTHRAVIESARDAICYTQDGMHINANKAYLAMFEYDDLRELEGVTLVDLIDKSDRPRFKEHSRKTGSDASAPQEFLAVRKSGARFHIETTMSPIVINGENCTQTVVTDVSKRRAVENKLRYLNEHDALTGLYNRHYFGQELVRAVERAKREHFDAAVVYVDLQDLRRVGKTHGHTAADRFLLASARILREIFGERAILARFGDHEFTVLLANAEAGERDALAKRMEQALAAMSFEENGTAVSCSFRVAHVAIDASSESAQKIMAGIYSDPEPAAAPAPPKAAAPKPKPPATPTPAPPTAARAAAPAAPSPSCRASRRPRQCRRPPQLVPRRRRLLSPFPLRYRRPQPALVSAALRRRPTCGQPQHRPRSAKNRRLLPKRCCRRRKSTNGWRASKPRSNRRLSNSTTCRSSISTATRRSISRCWCG
jgi:multidomain signaling protein FimX